MQGICDRRDEGERGHRDGVEVVGAKIAGDEPAAGDEDADDDSCRDLAGRTAECRLGERKQGQRDDDHGSGNRARESLRGTERRQQRRQRIRVDRGLRGLDQRNARRCNQALERHLRGDGEHDHHHEGTEIAAAEQHQSARAAAVRQHHAVAEQQATEEQHRRREGLLQVDRLAEIDGAAAGQDLARGDRDSDRQRIGPHQPAVSFRQKAAHAAHQAEAAQQTHGAVDQADDEAGEDDELRGFHRLFSDLSSFSVIASAAKQ
ncbi:hypothetical protein ABIF37_009106 [Bradyrhizobium diazoefficiens]